MPDRDNWFGSALVYRPTVYEYCQLALQPTLDSGAAERMGEILRRAETEPLLNFLLEEADVMVARLQPSLSDEHLKQQQQRLRGAVDAVWIDQLLATCDRASH
ncbi:hypothetical protein IQ254_28730 [Nodosilinea sp. LEGE 07088]|uniref:hypothetical protein n=1 Tax=Nodosilinea sp. LEGE 07088 TaxID=2777968 RepID=UPI00187EA2C2|nr:hypothetical protein [Nodosilinea sp. LEGE 07088]MBE9141140.1 hypothetical protein [Nodosilinea sp. LEGE 07088]